MFNRQSIRDISIKQRPGALSALDRIKRREFEFK